MLRDDIARIVYEGYTGMPWPDEDEYFNDAARKQADEILELPEIKKMREALKEVVAAIKYYCQDSNCIDTCPECELNGALAILNSLNTNTQ